MTARRVLVLNHFAVPRSGAGGTRHVELFGRLETWSFTLLAADRNLFDRSVQRNDPTLVTVPTIPYRGNNIMRVLNWVSFAVAAFLRSLIMPRPEVVYASSPHLLTGVAGWAIARIKRARFVLEIRDLWPEVLTAMGRLQPSHPLFRLLRRLEIWLYGVADHVVVLAEGSKRAIADLGVDEHKITFIPNGAEPSDFDPPDTRAALRAKFGFDGRVLVYAGAHGPANGLERLIEAAAAISESHPAVTVVLVGDGPSKDALVEKAHRLEASNVRFLDPVPKAEMPALLGAADVGLHVLADVPLFRYGVSPNKLFDYMAAGLPVLSNCPGEVGDFIDEANGGLTVEPDQLSTGIGRMAGASRDQLQGWGAAGRNYVGLHRSRVGLARRLEKVLEDVVATHIR